MSSVGRVSLDLNVNSKKFNKQVNGIEKQATKAFGSMSVAVGNIIANMVQKAIASVGDFVKDSINKGSELSELQNVVDSVFTSMSDKVEDFSKNALDAYGLTEAQSKKMVGTFGAMSKSFGYTEQQAYDMSTALTGLAGDVASFYNLSHDEAYTKLKSVFTGETESLKELGVVMTQAALEEFALQKGMKKTVSEMSEKEKVALRLAFVQNKLNTASGDFLRTQDQWANQTRILSGQFESLKAALGQGFINVLTPVIKALNTLMAKLVQAANMFKSFTEMVMGKRSGGGAGAAMKEVAEAAENAAESTTGIEDAANGAASAAKKAQKSLMGFDEINKLTKTDSSSSDSEGFSFDNVDLGAEAEGLEESTSPILDSIISKLEKIVELMKEGFKEGLGDNYAKSFENLKESLKGISSSFNDILTDKSVGKAATNWVKTISKSMGKVAGSFASIGQSIAEAVFGGLDRYLSQNKDFIKDKLVGIFDASAGIWEKASEFTAALASIFEVFRGDEAKQIYADFIGIFYNTYLGVTELATKLGEDFMSLVTQPIIENKDKLKAAIENTLKPISDIVSTISTSVRTTLEKAFDVYEQYIQPSIQKIKDGVSSVVSTLLDAYNTHIAPVLSNLGGKFSSVWAEHVQPALSKIIEIVGKVVEAISVLWQNVLVPVINWIVSNVVPVIAPILETIGSLVFSLFGTISDVVRGIFDALGGLIDFITGIFSGDWAKAWEGIKSFFSGIWDAIKGIVQFIWDLIVGIIITAVDIIKGIITTVFNAIKTVVTTIWNGIKTVISTVINGIKNVVTTGFNAVKNGISTVLNTIKSVVTGVFNGIWNFIKGIINGILGGIEGMVNGVIGGLNAMVRALNKLSFDVPDWVPVIGGGKFGFNLKELSKVSLPRLAEGGYVRANQPQPVIVGDNKRQGEIIAPEDKMLSVMLQALEQFFSRLKDNGYTQKENGDVGDIVIPIYLDGSMLDEVIVTASQRRTLRSGGM